MTPLQQQMREACRLNTPDHQRMADAAYSVVEPLLNDLVDEIEKGIAEVVAFDPHVEAIECDPSILLARAKEALS